MGTHKHHIIPKHAGGTDNLDNLIELTVAEHAEAHRKLFEQYGRWQDELAWKALSGQITTDDARREASRRAWLGKTHTLESREKIKAGIRKSGVTRGPQSEETKNKIRQSLVGHDVTDKTRDLWSKQRKGRKVSNETRQKISEANKGKIISEKHRQILKGPKSAEHKKKISEANKGKIRSEEVRQKNRLARLGKPHSEEWKQQQSERLKGKKIPWNLNNTTPEANEKRSQTMRGKSKPVLQCPYCGKTGGAPQMKQWHFDNCKEK